jgi:hypothetical protein
VGKPGLVLYQQNFSLTLYQKIQALSGYLPENQKLNFTKVGLLPTKQNYCGTVWLFTRKITNADRRQNTYLILVECTCTFIASYLGSPTSDFKNFKT